jgi:uncharacterized protein YkwD
MQPSDPSFTAEVVRLTNAERAEGGCAALKASDKLMLAAQRHSQDQANTGQMSHTGSDGSQPGDRVRAVGYAFSRLGENVAYGYRSPQSVVDAWMNSSGHRANIMNCSFTELGVGYATSPRDSKTPYWTQVFATPR